MWIPVIAPTIIGMTLLGVNDLGSMMFPKRNYGQRFATYGSSKSAVKESFFDVMFPKREPGLEMASATN